MCGNGTAASSKGGLEQSKNCNLLARSQAGVSLSTSAHPTALYLSSEVPACMQHEFMHTHQCCTSIALEIDMLNQYCSCLLRVVAQPL
jgi:hypothetical protein